MPWNAYDLVMTMNDFAAEHGEPGFANHCGKCGTKYHAFGAVVYCGYGTRIVAEKAKTGGA